MSIDVGVLVVGASSPSGKVKSDANMDDWIWLNPDTGELKKFNTSSGSFDIDIPIKFHEHLMSAITGLTDALAGKADSFTGISGTRTIDGHTLTFTNGILTGYQAP